MCLGGGGSGGRVPTVPVVKPPPTLGSVIADANGTGKKKVNPLVKEINKNKKRVQGQQGVFGNLATTPMGDASYGTATSAPRFGAR